MELNIITHCILLYSIQCMFQYTLVQLQEKLEQPNFDRESPNRNEYLMGARRGQ